MPMLRESYRREFHRLNATQSTPVRFTATDSTLLYYTNTESREYTWVRLSATTPGGKKWPWKKYLLDNAT